MPPALGDLYEERDFLLASLDDLERERADDDIDDDTYEQLRDDYTARAAAALRAIDAAERDPNRGTSKDEVAAAPRTGRRLAVVGGIVAFVAVAGFLLANAVGDRVDGGTATGNQQSVDGSADEVAAETRATLEAAVERNPDDPAAHLELARFLAPTDPTASLMAYDEVVALDPANVEAHAYGGWIVYLAGLPEEALERVDRALAVDPDFADARFFRGMILFQGLDDPAAAIVEFDRYLEIAPDGPLADQVRDVADAARVAAAEPNGVPAP